MVIIYVPVNPEGPQYREVQRKYLKDLQANGWTWKGSFEIPDRLTGGKAEFAIMERDTTTEEDVAAVLKQLEALLGHAVTLKQIPLFIGDMQKEMNVLNEKVRGIEEDTE